MLGRIIGGVVLGATIAAAAVPAGAEEKIVIGTGGKAGNYISLGTAICKAMNARPTGFKCEAHESKGSIDNLIGLKRVNSRWASPFIPVPEYPR
ncbi:MAG: hypothetical protein VW268_09855 [Rhodospirillaceae bacterium]